MSLGVSHDVFDGLTQVLVENGFKKSCWGLSVEDREVLGSVEYAVLTFSVDLSATGRWISEVHHVTS